MGKVMGKVMGKFKGAYIIIITTGLRRSSTTPIVATSVLTAELQH